MEADLDLKSFDNKCVRIVTTFGEIYEGTVSFEDREYAFHEYGHDQEAGRWLRPPVEREKPRRTERRILRRLGMAKKASRKAGFFMGKTDPSQVQPRRPAIRSAHFSRPSAEPLPEI